MLLFRNEDGAARVLASLRKEAISDPDRVGPPIAVEGLGPGAWTSQADPSADYPQVFSFAWRRRNAVILAGLSGLQDAGVEAVDARAYAEAIDERARKR